MSKEFKTYNAQMRHLRDCKGINCCGSDDKQILIRHGYFNLINGYKTPFIAGKDSDGKYKYVGKTKLSHFEAVKNFDTELRIHLMKYIVQVEEEIRTLVGHKFDSVNNNGSINWYDVEAYNPNIDIQRRMRVIAACINETDRSHQAYIKHYFNKHKEVPTWVFVKTLNYSTFIKLFEICKEDVKNSVCNLYGIVDIVGIFDYKLIVSMMHWMRKIRNSCAHNERIYGMIKEDGRVALPFKTFLPNRKDYQKHRTQRVMDLLVYMRYFLQNDEYDAFIDKILELLRELQNKLNPNAFSKVRADLGIKNLDDLEVLKQKKKNINYNSF